MTLSIRMKCQLDYCRLQWVIREFVPLKYVFKNEFKESRFCELFAAIFEKGEEKKKRSSLSSSDDQNNAQVKNKSGEQNMQAIETTISPNQTYHTKIVEIPKIISQEDKRTTLMIKNIPNKFTKSFFLELFMKDFQGQYDLFLLPMDLKDKRNFGYGFINFIDCIHIIHFYELFNGKKWPNTNSLKICEIVYSKMQGIKKLLKHYPLKSSQKNTNIEKEKKEYAGYSNGQVRIVLPKVSILINGCALTLGLY